MRVNARRRELCLKIVYYGAGLSGKTTNLLSLHASYTPEARGELIRLDTETERTLFFDYFPVSFGDVGGYKVKFDLFTVPGQSFYQATRRAVLEGVDGIVFVADSSPEREEANLLARADMLRALEERNRRLDDVPHVYQWNKRDVRRPLSLRILERTLNPEGAESFEAVASSGAGVWETQEAIIRRVLGTLRRRDSRGEAPHV